MRAEPAASESEQSLQPVSGLCSVLIPAYNRANLIEATLDSVLGQHYRPVEVVVVDDGSSDDTVERVRSWRDQHQSSDLSLRLICSGRQGVDASRNEAFAASRGEFVQFLDSDDLLHSEKLAMAVPAFDDPEVDIVACRHMAFDGDAQSVDLAGAPKEFSFGENFERSPYFTRMTWELWMPVFRRSLIQSTGPMRTGIKAGGAYAYTTAIKLLSNKRVYLPYCLTMYRRGVGNSLTSIANSDRVPATVAVYQWINDCLVNHQITDRKEWRNLTIKLMRGYSKALAAELPGDSLRMLELARSASQRWNILAAIALRIPERGARLIVWAVRALKRQRPPGQSGTVSTPEGETK